MSAARAFKVRAFFVLLSFFWSEAVLNSYFGLVDAHFGYRS